MIRMATYLLSDTHFEHKNIIEYSGRPFNNLEEMNNYIIQKWNETIKPDDEVYFLGDFCFGVAENIMKYATQLNGHKHIVMGNHDRKKTLYKEAGFITTEKRIVYPYATKKQIILSHKPILDLPEGCVNIHGHIHEKQLDTRLFNVENYYNVSVENINYTPKLLQEIIQEKGW